MDPFNQSDEEDTEDDEERGPTNACAIPAIKPVGARLLRLRPRVLVSFLGFLFSNVSFRFGDESLRSGLTVTSSCITICPAGGCCAGGGGACVGGGSCGTGGRVGGGEGAGSAAIALGKGLKRTRRQVPNPGTPAMLMLSSCRGIQLGTGCGT